jgi:hypothetical protein
LRSWPISPPHMSPANRPPVANWKASAGHPADRSPSRRSDPRHLQETLSMALPTGAPRDCRISSVTVYVVAMHWRNCVFAQAQTDDGHSGSARLRRWRVPPGGCPRSSVRPRSRPGVVYRSLIVALLERDCLRRHRLPPLARRVRGGGSGDRKEGVAGRAGRAYRRQQVATRTAASPGSATPLR